MSSSYIVIGIGLAEDPTLSQQDKLKFEFQLKKLKHSVFNNISNKFTSNKVIRDNYVTWFGENKP
jgi:hypothetical protein